MSSWGDNDGAPVGGRCLGTGCCWRRRASMPRVWRLRLSTCTPAGSSTGACWVTTRMHSSYHEVVQSVK